MDDMSWRAQLAKSNINILNMTWNKDNTVVDIFYEFMYHPYNGSTKWCKTWTQAAGEVVCDEADEWQKPVTGERIAKVLRNETLKLRKELEG